MNMKRSYLLSFLLSLMLATSACGGADGGFVEGQNNNTGADGGTTATDDTGVPDDDDMGTGDPDTGVEDPDMGDPDMGDPDMGDPDMGDPDMGPSCTTETCVAYGQNSIAECSEADECVRRCEMGFSDIDGDIDDPMGNGCEIECEVTNGGVEICDGIDNDCNGVEDDPWIAELGTDCQSSGQGACVTTGEVVCTEDQTGTMCDAVEGQPSTETCDGIDNNCNGVEDDPWMDELGDPCTSGEGVCRESGQLVCATNGSGTVCDAVPSDPDPSQANGETLCDGLDNDCDGFPDDEFDDLGDPCSVGFGVCERSGTKICASNKAETTCSATPGTPDPSQTVTDETICDGLDNDCDEDTDELCDMDGDGYCTSDLEPGTGSAVGPCTEGFDDCDDDPSTGQNVYPGGPPLCDGKDNDCNGTDDDVRGIPDSADNPQFTFGNVDVSQSTSDPRTLTRIMASPSPEGFCVAAIDDSGAFGSELTMMHVKNDGTYVVNVSGFQGNPTIPRFGNENRSSTRSGIDAYVYNVRWTDDHCTALITTTTETPLNTGPTIVEGPFIALARLEKGIDLLGNTIDKIFWDKIEDIGGSVGTAPKADFVYEAASGGVDRYYVFYIESTSTSSTSDPLYWREFEVDGTNETLGSARLLENVDQRDDSYVAAAKQEGSTTRYFLAFDPSGQKAFYEFRPNNFQAPLNLLGTTFFNNGPVYSVLDPVADTLYTVGITSSSSNVYLSYDFSGSPKMAGSRSTSASNPEYVSRSWFAGPLASLQDLWIASSIEDTVYHFDQSTVSNFPNSTEWSNAELMHPEGFTDILGVGTHGDRVHVLDMSSTGAGSSSLTLEIHPYSCY